MAASHNQGYQKSGAIAARTDAQLEGMADKPTTTLNAGRGEGAIGSGAQAAGDANLHSIASRPGYYHEQTPQADMEMAYRLAAAGALHPGSQAADNIGIEQRLAQQARDSVGSALSGFKVELTPKDVEFIESRRQEKLQVEFDDWLCHAVDLTDPGQSRWIQEKYPQLYERRLRVIDDKIALEARAAKIAARGAQSVDDYKFLFALNKGYMELSPTPQWMGQAGAGYEAGMFRRKGATPRGAARATPLMGALSIAGVRDGL